MPFEKGNTYGRRFQPGNPGGPGRPPLTKALRDVKKKADGDVDALYLVLRAKAMEGDVSAIRLCLHIAGALKLDAETAEDEETEAKPEKPESVDEVEARVIRLTRGGA